MGCHSLLQGIFPTQGSNLGLLHYRQILNHVSYQGSPISPWYITRIPKECEVQIVIKQVTWKIFPLGGKKNKSVTYEEKGMKVGTQRARISMTAVLSPNWLFIGVPHIWPTSTLPKRCRWNSTGVHCSSWRLSSRRAYLSLVFPLRANKWALLTPGFSTLLLPRMNGTVVTVTTARPGRGDVGERGRERERENKQSDFMLYTSLTSPSFLPGCFLGVLSTLFWSLGLSVLWPPADSAR